MDLQASKGATETGGIRCLPSLRGQESCEGVADEWEALFDFFVSIVSQLG